MERLSKAGSTLLLLFYLYAAIGCARDGPAVTPSAATPLPQPSSVLADSEPAITKMTEETITGQQTLRQGMAALSGTIQVTSTFLLGELYLATALPTNQPAVYVLELDTASAARAVLDRDSGRFYFSNVAPGTYGIIIWEPMASAPLADPQSGETLFVELKADQVVDVGILRYP